MTPQEKKELDYVLKVAKEVVLFMATVILGFIIVVNVFL
jgi:hypothetical protein